MSNKPKVKSEMAKRRVLPDRFEAGFLRELDKRTELYQQLNSNFETIMQDMGGADVSHTMRSLVERFVFLEAAIRSWELQIVTKPSEANDLIGRWVQAVNALQGLAKLIGLKRELKTINVRDYVAAKS